MLQSNESLPDVPRVPAPWSLRGHAWMVALRLPAGDPARTAFVPPASAGNGEGRRFQC